MYVSSFEPQSSRAYSVSRYRRPVTVPMVLVHRHGGLSALSPQNQSIASVAAAGASSTVGMLVALGTLGGPVGAAIAGLIAVAAALVNVFGGCGQTCVQASNIANQVGDILQKNLDAYLSTPVRHASLQAAALNNFDTAWNALVQACSNPQLAAAGQRCISDRQSGACHWKTSPGGWTQNSDGSWTFVPGGPAGSGEECWNWFSGMRDPIANDPAVLPDPSPISAVSSGVLSDFGVNPSATVAGIPISDLLLPAAVILLAAIL